MLKQLDINVKNKNKNKRNLHTDLTPLSEINPKPCNIAEMQYNKTLRRKHRRKSR